MKESKTKDSDLLQIERTTCMHIYRHTKNLPCLITRVHFNGYENSSYNHKYKTTNHKNECDIILKCLPTHTQMVYFILRQL